MKIRKKICAFFLAVILAASGFLGRAPMEAYVKAAQSTTQMGNEFLQYTLNRETGGFSIDTLEGHPQKKYDDNIPLLYQESNAGMETSYVTLRVKDDSLEAGYADYIWGQDYSWLLGDGQGELTVSEPVKDGDATVMKATWTILGLAVTQTVALSNETEGNSDTTGNLGISYSIENKSGESVNAGLRVLLDTALSNEIDAPYLMTGDNDYVTVEKEFAGEVGTQGGIPTQIRGVDSLSSPTRMCYAIFNGWEGKEVDRVIQGHWANLANHRYEYTPDPSCDFTNRSNKYITADSAMALYWDEMEIANGAKSEECQFLYGVGNFSTELAEKKVNVNMTVGNVELAEDGKGYADDGIFTVEATLDNTATQAETLVSASMTLNLEEGLTLVTEEAEGYETQPEFTWPEIPAGEQITKKFRVKAEPQSEITAKAVSISVNTINQINERASRYVVLPNALGEAAKVKFSSVTPERIYTEGDRSFAIAGEFKAFEALRGENGWAMQLVSTVDGASYDVDKKNISFDDETWRSMSAIVDEEMELPVGMYKIVFTFNDMDLIKGFGKALDTNLKLEVSADPELKDPNYGIIALVRYDTTNYVFVPFPNEEEYHAFLYGEKGAEAAPQGRRKVTLQANNYVDEEKADPDMEVLVTLRGKAKEIKPEDGGMSSYIVRPSDDGSNVTMNNCISCENNVVLRYEESNNHGKYSAFIEGEGDIRVINSISFWKSEWSIETAGGVRHTMGEIDGDHGSEALTVSLGGAAQMIQSIGGMVVDLKYGELTREVLKDGEEEGFGYGVSFGGSLSIPISIAEGKDKEKNPSQTPGASPSTTPTATPTSTPGGGGNPSGPPTPSGTPAPGGEYEPNDGSLLSANIENILYGEKSLKDYLNPEAKGASDSGYIGTDVTVGVGLPENIMGKLVTNSKGAYATVHVDTIEGIYSVSAGMKVAILEVEGTLAFATVEMDGVERTLPDELAFNIAKGLKVPIVAPTLFMTGIGGGISELAATIGGDYVQGLPPLTIAVQMAINAVEVLDGNFSASISAFGMSLDGTVAPKGALADVMEINGGMSARWIDPFYVNLYGNVNVLEIITGGVTVTIKEDYFYGYAFVAISLPDSIPLVGGKELARIEAAVSDRYIGANVKIIGIGLGVIYYFDSGSVDIGGDIDLGQIEESVGRASLAANDVVEVPTQDGIMTFNEEDVLAIEEEQVKTPSGDREECTIIVGSNLHKLKTRKESQNAVPLGLRNAPKAAGRQKAGSVLTWSMEASDRDSLLIEIPFLGDKLPKAQDLSLEASVEGKPYSLTLQEYSEKNPEAGNLVIQKMEDGVNYIFITVAGEDKEELDKLGQGEITFHLTVATEGINISKSRETLYGVDELPRLTKAQAVTDSEDSMKVKGGWEIEGAENYPGKLSAYLTTDPDVIEKVQKETAGKKEGAVTEENADMGILIWEADQALKSGSFEVDLPDTIPSGEYYLVMTSSVDKAGATTAVSEEAITIRNGNLPQKPREARLEAVGDQQLRLNIEDSPEADYNEYYIELYDSETEELVTSGFHPAGRPVVFGKVIEAAVEDNPETKEVNEAAPEKVLEVGKSYYAVVKASRLEKPEYEEEQQTADDPETTIDYMEKRYISDDSVKAEAVEIPKVHTPKLMSVTMEGMEETRKGDRRYTNQSHVKVVYTFDTPVNFTLNLDGLDLTGLSSSEDMRQWTFEKDMEDGSHTLDFTARNAAGDTLRSTESLDTIGFVVDTEAPMLAIGGSLRQNVDSQTGAGSGDAKTEAQTGQDERFTNVSSQSVVADEEGKYRIIGHTEPDIGYWIYSGLGSLDIADDGSFIIDGTAEFTDEVYQTETLIVRDKAGNENKVTLYIINGNIKYPDRLVITNNGKEIEETDGVKLLKMKAGETVNLKAVGYDQEGKVVVYDESRLLWDTMYESNMVNLKEGNVTAKGTGETAVKVVLPYSNVLTDENGGGGSEEQTAADGEIPGTEDRLAQELEHTKKMGPEDFVKITITDGSNQIISFAAGGGEGNDPDSIRALAGTIITLPECPYTMEDGTEFEGWSDGTNIYPAGSTMVVPNESITLIAKWVGKDLEEPTPPWWGGGGGTTPTPTETPTPEPTLTPGEIEGYTPKIKCEKNMATQVKISWEKLSGVDGYYVYKKLPGGKWQRTDRVSANTNTYTFKGLKSVQKYYFTVKAYVETEDGEYVYSKYMTDFRKQTRPEIPEISVKDKTHNTVTIQWKGVPRARMYYIYKTNDKGKREIIKKLKGTRRSYVVKGLESGKKYHITVRAMANKMPSEYPADLTPITLLPQPDVEVRALGGGRVKVNWTKIPGAEKYNVYYRSAGGKKWTRAQSLKADKRTCTIGGLKGNRTYEFSVKGNAMVGKRLTYSKHLTNIRIQAK